MASKSILLVLTEYSWNKMKLMFEMIVYPLSNWIWWPIALQSNTLNWYTDLLSHDMIFELKRLIQSTHNIHKKVCFSVISHHFQIKLLTKPFVNLTSVRLISFAIRIYIKNDFDVNEIFALLIQSGKSINAIIVLDSVASIPLNIIKMP